MAPTTNTNCPLVLRVCADLTAEQWVELMQAVTEMQLGDRPVFGDDGDHILAVAASRLLVQLLDERAAQRRHAEVAQSVCAATWDGTGLHS